MPRSPGQDALTGPSPSCGFSVGYVRSPSQLIALAEPIDQAQTYTPLARLDPVCKCTVL